METTRQTVATKHMVNVIGLVWKKHNQNVTNGQNVNTYNKQKKQRRENQDTRYGLLELREKQ